MMTMCGLPWRTLRFKLESTPSQFAHEATYTTKYITREVMETLENKLKSMDYL
jgi:hypothetical protein